MRSFLITLIIMWAVMYGLALSMEQGVKRQAAAFLVHCDKHPTFYQCTPDAVEHARLLTIDD